jgi:hypothetical protein
MASCHNPNNLAIILSITLTRLLNKLRNISVCVYTAVFINSYCLHYERTVRRDWCRAMHAAVVNLVGLILKNCT